MMEKSQRTKNRMREHNLVPWGKPPIVHVFQGGGPLSGRECMYFRCSCCDWIGWLPVDELSDDDMRPFDQR